MISLEDDSFFYELKEGLANFFEKALLEGVFPGAVVGVSLGSGSSRKKIILPCGHSSLYPNKETTEINTVFDLASLTKPLATSLATLALIKEKKISLKDNLPDLLEKEVPADKERITLRHLLSHCSGLPDYRPYYEQLKDIPLAERKEALLSKLLAEPVLASPGEKAVYSDLGFLFLGYMIEKKSGFRLDRYVADTIIDGFGVGGDLFFQPLDVKKKAKPYASTENCPWRGKILCGEVHDDNAYVLGGVCGHAGLFGDAASVLGVLTDLLDQWQGRKEHPNYTNADLKVFLTRQSDIKGNTWALGFDTPSVENSSAGRYFSRKSIGHLGFTGTSFWVDPERELVVVLLTNRVHPTRENNKIRQFRPLFHDRVIELLRCK